MPVVVDEDLVADLLGPEDETRVAMRPQADGRADDAIPGGDDRRQAKRRAQRARRGPTGGAASREADRGQAAGREEGATIHLGWCHRIIPSRSPEIRGGRLSFPTKLLRT